MFYSIAYLKDDSLDFSLQTTRRFLTILLHTKVTLKDVVTTKLGNVWVMGDEVVQEVGELVALA